MRKNICLEKLNIATLGIIMVMTLGLTACGTSTATSPSKESIDYVAPEQEPLADGDLEGYAGEGEIQGGMPSDEELAEREQEASSTDSWDGEEDPDYPDANVEMTETPTSSDTFISSDNFWNGDDYFDLEEYLYMNGANDVFPTDGTDYQPTDGQPKCYIGQFFNKEWEITIMPETGLSLQHRGVDNEGYIVRDRIYIVDCGIVPEKHFVTVDAKGTKMLTDVIMLLDQVIPVLKENYTQECPLDGSGIIYG